MIIGPDHLIFIFIKGQSFTDILLFFYDELEFKNIYLFYNRQMANTDRREESMW